jgi:TrmH family RNA methyltransferase
MDFDISSPSNERVKRLVNLRDRKHRDREQLFPVEERRVVERASARGIDPTEVYWCPDLVDRPPVENVSAVSMSVDAMKRASYRSTPEGSISLYSYLPTGLDQIEGGNNSLVLVAEGLEKPGNLGALLRIADAAGISGVVVVAERVDPFNPNVVRSSTGAIFTVPLALTSVNTATEWLREREYTSVAAVVDAPETLWDADLTGSLAIWVGAESPGLSAHAVDFADRKVAIPMKGATDSLNVAVSAGILVYEAVRQRAGQAG